METSHHFIKKLEYYLNHNSDNTLNDQKTDIVKDVERLQIYLMKSDGSFNYEVVNYLKNHYPAFSSFWNIYSNQEKEQKAEQEEKTEEENILMEI